jgi:hypothetical protein
MIIFKKKIGDKIVFSEYYIWTLGFYLLANIILLLFFWGLMTCIISEPSNRTYLWLIVIILLFELLLIYFTVRFIDSHKRIIGISNWREQEVVKIENENYIEIVEINNHVSHTSFFSLFLLSGPIKNYDPMLDNDWIWLIDSLSYLQIKNIWKLLSSELNIKLIDEIDFWIIKDLVILWLILFCFFLIIFVILKLYFLVYIWNSPF